MAALIREFAADPKIHALLVLLALDTALGVVAALHAGTFRLSLIADFLRQDVLSKVIPYFALWAAVHAYGDVDLGQFGIVEDTAYALIVAALVGSVLKSLRDLGLVKAPDEIAGPEKPPPLP